MEQYWEDPGTVSQAMRYSTTRSSFYELLDDETVFLPLACRGNPAKLQIRKSGPGVCQAELTLDSTVWLDRYGSYLGCFGAGYAYNESAEDYTQELEAPDSVKTAVRSSASPASSMCFCSCQKQREPGRLITARCTPRLPRRNWQTERRCRYEFQYRPRRGNAGSFHPASKQSHRQTADF